MDFPNILIADFHPATGSPDIARFLSYVKQFKAKKKSMFSIIEWSYPSKIRIIYA
jgi:hypothetical protein